MSLETHDVLLKNYQAIRAGGDKIIDADAQFVIEGLEEYRFLAKEFPHPAPLGSGEVAEFFGTNGQKLYQATNSNTAQQGNLVAYCQADGALDALLAKIIEGKGGRFNATIYEGSMEAHIASHYLRDCIFTPETGSRSLENKSQVLTLSGQLSFHYFNETAKGNVKSLYNY